MTPPRTQKYELLRRTAIDIVTRLDVTSSNTLVISQKPVRTLRNEKALRNDLENNGGIVWLTTEGRFQYTSLLSVYEIGILKK